MQQNLLRQLPRTRGCTLAVVIAGSDKTTVSIATGHNEYHPLYMGLGNVENDVRKADRGAIAVVAFLAIPNSKFPFPLFVMSPSLIYLDEDDRKYDNVEAYRTFRRHLFHSSLSGVFSSLRPYMTKYKILLCPDGDKRRVIFSLGPYIADYPEQVQLAGVVYGWCARSVFVYSLFT